MKLSTIWIQSCTNLEEVWKNHIYIERIFFQNKYNIAKYLRTKIQANKNL